MALGGSLFGPDEYRGEKAAVVLETMAAALERGINHFDTASDYGAGESEKLIGRFDDVLWEGQVHDPARIDYIRSHIGVLPGLIAAGVPVVGYFCWSLLDNFEWAMGTRDRFGLIYVDFATQQRVIKDSGHWYSRVARANALVD